VIAFTLLHEGADWNIDRNLTVMEQAMCMKIKSWEIPP